MRHIFEPLENRSRAMDIPVASGKFRTVVIILALFAWSVAAFHLGG